MGSMNMPGVSLSLLNLTNIAEECSFTSTSHLLELIDAPHNTPGWPATQNMYPVPANLASRKRADQFIEVEKEEKVVHTGGPKLIGTSAQAVEMLVLTLVVDAQAFREAMKVASDDTIALEPDLTRWDTVSLLAPMR